MWKATRDKSIGDNRFEAAVITCVIEDSGKGVVALRKLGLHVGPGNVLAIFQVGHVNSGIHCVHLLDHAADRAFLQHPDLPMSAFGTVDHYLTPSPLKRLPRLYFAPRL